MNGIIMMNRQQQQRRPQDVDNDVDNNNNIENDNLATIRPTMTTVETVTKVLYPLLLFILAVAFVSLSTEIRDMRRELAMTTRTTQQQQQQSSSSSSSTMMNIRRTSDTSLPWSTITKDMSLSASSTLANTQGTSTTRPIDGPDQDTNDKLQILIVYGPSDDPYLPIMADSIALGVAHVNASMNKSRTNGGTMIESVVKTIETATFDDVMSSQGIIVGSPVQNANTHPAVQAWMNNEWDLLQNLRDKVGAAFVTAGGFSAGEETTAMSVLQSLLVFNMIVVGGIDWMSPFGASAIIFEQPFTNEPLDPKYFPQQCYQPNTELVHPMFKLKARNLGERVADVVARLHGDNRPTVL